jgi:3-oxoacyl-[acyl-carrier protein] reductase
LRLDRKAALVTGGGRGIGRAVSLLFARLGARVCVNYARDEGSASRTVDEIRSAGGDAFAQQADLSEPERAGFLVEGVTARFGALDVVVVNHGIWKRASIHEMSWSQWDEMVRVNLGGTYAVCHHAARHMIERRSGAIITIASTSGQRGEAHYSHYSATKGAVISFTRSLAAELAPHGIRVNGVAPGWVLTDMTRDALMGAGGEAAARAIPVGRPGTPEEIAAAVAFLASDMASYVYGEILCVNGGTVMAE